jgi:hypothetical protein
MRSREIDNDKTGLPHVAMAISGRSVSTKGVMSVILDTK